MNILCTVRVSVILKEHKETKKYVKRHLEETLMKDVLTVGQVPATGQVKSHNAIVRLQHSCVSLTHYNVASKALVTAVSMTQLRSKSDVFDRSDEKCNAPESWQETQTSSVR
jgi:hypothetical protein